MGKNKSALTRTLAIQILKKAPRMRCCTVGEYFPDLGNPGSLSYEKLY